MSNLDGLTEMEWKAGELPIGAQGAAAHYLDTEFEALVKHEGPRKGAALSKLKQALSTDEHPELSWQALAQWMDMDWLSEESAGNVSD